MGIFNSLKADEDHDIAIVKHSSYYTTDHFTNTRLATGSLYILSLTLSDPGYFRQLAIRGGGGGLL